MEFVAGEGEADGANADLLAVSGAAASPGLGIEVAEQRDRRAAHGDEVFDEVLEGAAGERAVANVVVLLEAFDRGLVATRDAEGTVGEDAFGVVYVAEQFFDAPLARGV